MSLAALDAVLNKLQDLYTAKEESLKQATDFVDQMYDKVTEKSQLLHLLDRQKREAINAYRPVKRQYVHQYRQECIYRRQILEKRQNDLEMIKKLMGFTLVKVHNTRKQSQSNDDFLAELQQQSCSPLKLKRCSSLDSIFFESNKKGLDENSPKIIMSPLALEQPLLVESSAVPKSILKISKHVGNSAVSKSV